MKKNQGLFSAKIKSAVQQLVVTCAYCSASSWPVKTGLIILRVRRTFHSFMERAKFSSESSHDSRKADDSRMICEISQVSHERAYNPPTSTARESAGSLWGLPIPPTSSTPPPNCEIAVVPTAVSRLPFRKNQDLGGVQVLSLSDAVKCIL